MDQPAPHRMNGLYRVQWFLVSTRKQKNLYLGWGPAGTGETTVLNQPHTTPAHRAYYTPKAEIASTKAAAKMEKPRAEGLAEAGGEDGFSSAAGSRFFFSNADAAVLFCGRERQCEESGIPMDGAAAAERLAFSSAARNSFFLSDAVAQNGQSPSD